jgi:hypothetical protein
MRLLSHIITLSFLLIVTITHAKYPPEPYSFPAPPPPTDMPIESGVYILLGISIVFALYKLHKQK